MTKRPFSTATVFLTLLGLFFLMPSALRAQTCALDPLPAGRAAGMSATSFLPNGREGQILVRKKHSDTTVVRVFEAKGADPTSWKAPNEPFEVTVISVRPAPENTYPGFTPTDSSIIRFLVPRHADGLWQRRTFLVRLCEDVSSGGALAVVPVLVSPPRLAKIISIVVLAILYCLFAFAVSRSRAKPHPLAVKYPAFEPHKKLGWLRHLDPVVLTANAFNTGSIQKLQVLLFTLLVSGMVFSLVLTLGVLSDLSPTVALLLGISAVGAAVAQKTTTTRNRLDFENWAWLVKKKVLPINQAEKTEPKWGDLVVTNREFDVYKLQTLIFSVVVAVALLVGGEERLASFAVPETLLGILGLSQVVYVAGTLARPASIGDLDQAVTNLREMESKLQTCIARKTDTDDKGKLPDKLPDPQPPPASQQELNARIANAKNAVRLYSDLADQVEIMIESSLNAKVERDKLDPSVNGVWHPTTGEIEKPEKPENPEKSEQPEKS
jgi:hypothetical protein